MSNRFLAPARGLFPTMSVALLSFASSNFAVQAQPTTTPATKTQSKNPTTAPVVTRVRLYPREGFAQRLKGARIQGSNLNATSGFVDLATVGTVADKKWIEVKIAKAVPYKYLRVFMPDGSYANIAEVEFYAGKNRIDGQPYGTFGSLNDSGATFSKAFDADVKTYFDAPIANSQYLGIEIASPADASTQPIAATDTKPVGTARRHYHIGNSLTDTIGEFMQATAKAAGYNDDFFDRQTIPGSPLHFNWKSEGGFGTPYRMAFIKHAPLTDLVMQVFIDNGDSQDATYSLNFYDLARENSPQVKPWIYGQWPVTGGGSTAGGATGGSPDWEERTMAYMRTYVAHALNFAHARPDAKVEVVPGGLALIHLKRATEAGKVPGVKKFFAFNFDDDLHVSGRGRYFIGLVHFAALYNQSPVGVPLAGINNTLPELTPEQTKAYQQIAWETVQQFRQTKMREVGVLVPAHIDARFRVGSTPPYGDPYLRYIGKGSAFEYLVRAPREGKYELRVSMAAGSENPLEILVNHQAAGTVMSQKTDGAFVDSAPLAITLKEGLNLVRLNVPVDRPYDIESLKITSASAPLKNTLPQTNFNGFQRDIEPGASYTELFNVSDAETVADKIKVTATSSNQAVVPDANIKIESGEFKNEWGNVFNQRFTVTPAAGQTGEARILVTIADDGVATDKAVKPLQRVVSLRLRVKPKENKTP